MNTNIFRRSVQFYRTIMIRLLIIASLILACLNMEAQGLRVAFIGDPQVDDITELEYARRSIYAELKQRKDLDLIIILGDLVNDQTALIAPSKESLDSLSCSWFAVPGNHDFDVYEDKERLRDLSSWKQMIGYTDTTYVHSGVRFILMNDVIYSKDRGYDGGFNPEAVAFMDSVLVNTPTRSQVVLCTHIPVSHTKECKRIYELFSEHKNVLYVSGHTHSVSRHYIPAGAMLHEEIIAGAASGSWWRGVKGPDGIPYALQNCGAPRGYFVVDFLRNRIKTTYTPLSEEYGLSARISDIADKKLLIINVFGGNKAGDVQVRIPGMGRMLLKRTDSVAPEVLDVIAFNKSLTADERRKRRSDIIPLRRIRSPHLWAVELPTDLVLPENVKVVYSDRAMKFRAKVPVSVSR